MTNHDLPVAMTLPGDPDALRRAADAVQHVITSTGPTAVSDARAAQASALAGWHGPAGAAFASAAGDSATRAEGLVANFPGVPTVLRGFADVLEQARRDYTEAQAVYEQAAAAIRITPRDTPETQQLGDVYLGAEARLDQIIAAVEAASADAGRAVDAVAEALDNDAVEARKFGLTAVSNGAATALTSAYTAATRVLGEGTLTALTKGVNNALTPATSVVSGVIEDSENPNYSVAERTGRALAKGVVNGIPAALAGWGGAAVGGAIGTAVGGPLAPVTFVVGAVAGGGAAAYGMDAFVSGLPFQDDLIDAAGEATDDVATTIGGVLSRSDQETG